MSTPSSVSGSSLDPEKVSRTLFADPDQPEVPTIEGVSGFSFIARGGLGEIWRANWDEAERAVAVKVPRRVDDEFFARLEAEAATLQALDHPHIVRLLDVCLAADGRPCLVLEFIDGKSLAATLPAEGYPVKQALGYFHQVLDAVEAAHQCGIVHRDLKPSNLLVGSDGVLKVGDFGLAADIHQRSVRLALTESGAVAGTVEYLPPEAFRAGASADRRTDIYALGILLYELLTGEPPRGGWHDASELRRGVDVRLDDVIRKAIHRDPAKRYAGVGEMRADLERIAASRPRYSGSPRFTRACQFADLAWSLAGCFALLLAVSTAFYLDRSVTRLPLNLFGAHSELICAWLTVKTLLITCGCMGAWQLLRLWRFHRVPMREALPSPFGLALGDGTLAAILVLLAQTFLFLLPLVLAGSFFGSIEWRRPDATTWSHVLAVTDYLSHPIGIWDWGANWDGKEAWLREVTMQPDGWYLNTQQPHDKISFYPGFQPAMMVACATLAGLAIAATALAVAVAWWERHRPLLLTLVGVAVVAGGTHLHTSQLEVQRRRLVEAQLYPDPENYDVETSFTKFVFELLQRRDGFDLLERRLQDYAREVIVNGERLEREGSLREYLAMEVRESREHQRVWVQIERHFSQERGGARILLQREFYDSPHPMNRAAGGGGVEELTLWGQHQADGRWLIDEERLQRAVTYSASNDFPQPGELEAFADAFLDSLAEPACPRLQDFLADPMFGKPVGKRLALLRVERLGWTSLTIEKIHLSQPKLRPGRRWEFDLEARRDGVHSIRGQRSEKLSWQLEVAKIDGKWRILRLAM